MSTVQSNNFSFFMGAFGLMTTVVSAMLCSRLLLPSALIKKLDEAYNETNDIYLKGVADGLLPNISFRIEIEDELATYDNLRSDFRERVFQALSVRDEIYGLFAGLTSGIRETTFGLRQLRCRIVTTTQETRREMEARRQREHPCLEYQPLSRSETMIFDPYRDDQSNAHTMDSLNAYEDSKSNCDLHSSRANARTAKWARLQCFVLSILCLHQPRKPHVLPMSNEHSCKLTFASSSSSSQQASCLPNEAPPMETVTVNGNSAQVLCISDVPMIQVPAPTLSLASVQVLNYTSR